ncbi:MAG: peptidase domain-containing ABC transporter, partial [Sphingobacteriales bacterium]
MKKFSFYKQLDAMDCGPTCLRMIAKFYGKTYSLEYLRSQSYITRQGVSMLGISEAAEQIGFRTLAVKIGYDALIEEAPFPLVLHWNDNHFVVVPEQNFKKNKIYVADPAHGLVHVDKNTFLRSWMGAANEGIAMLLEPTQKFFEENRNESSISGFRFLFGYLKPHRRYLIQLLISVLLGGVLSLIFPFLTQSMVDYGINRQDISYVYLILISQVLLFLGSTAIELIRSWILLH